MDLSATRHPPKKKVAVYEQTVPTRTSMASPLWKCFGEETQFSVIEKAVCFFRFRWYIVRVTTTTTSLWQYVSTKFTRQIAVPQESPDPHRMNNLFDTGWNLTSHITKRANIPSNACGLQVQCERCFFLVTITREIHTSR